mgnify:CR=1 FL=1
MTQCPKNYLANTMTMTCDFQNEMAFPFPFSILAILVSLGLVIARFMRAQTRYFVTVIAFTDTVLKLNWFFLWIFLLSGKYFTSAGIITYCLAANFIINFGLWKILLKRNRITEDELYLKYCTENPKFSKTLRYLSYVISFQVFRLSFSGLFGKKGFSA